MTHEQPCTCPDCVTHHRSVAHEAGYFDGLHRRPNERYGWIAHTAYEEGYQAGRSVWRRPRRTRRAHTPTVGRTAAGG